MYIFLTILILFFALIILYLPFFKNFRKKYSDLTSFIITISATFIGVFLAIELSNFAMRESEKNKTLELLHVSKSDLEATIFDIWDLVTFASIIEESKLDTIKIVDVLRSRHIPFPSSFEKIIKSEPVLSNLSPSSNLYFFRTIERFRLWISMINNFCNGLTSNKSDQYIKSLFQNYLDEIRIMQLMILQEEEYLNVGYPSPEFYDKFHEKIVKEVEEAHKLPSNAKWCDLLPNSFHKH